MVWMLGLVGVALAELPVAPTPDCSESNLGACLNDLSGWRFYSWIPEDTRATVRPAEHALGSGMAADIAFRHSTGRFDVTVAVIDSGFEWHRMPEKIALHLGELPKPQRADGSEADSYDLDGNGLVNVWDYAEDPRVARDAGHPRAADILDPSDLIATFSDGVDGDGNGYVDDIAGWDFFGWDNDPYADLEKGHSSHGTGVARTIGEPGGDGGELGVCPNCAVLPLRYGDTFISDGDRAGLAIAYAADRGVQAVAMAIGSLTQPGFVEQAIDYADAKGVVLVAAAGDENSWHHNLPAAEDPVLYVHTVAPNLAGDTFTYMNFVNCCNFGPRVDLVAGKDDCATGSTATIAGAAGLVASAGRDHVGGLSAAEVRSLLRGTATDIYLPPEDLARARTYPSQPGWDAFYGYGRLNLGAAVEAVVRADVPPEVRLTDPDWFAWAKPGDGPVSVRGRVAADRSDGVSWVLSAGAGAEPTEWIEVARGDGPVDGELGSFDPSSWGGHTFEDLRSGQKLLERFERAHQPMVQLKLVATDAEGRLSEDRHGFWVHDDPDLLPGFPRDFDVSLEPAPIVFDFDGDGAVEIVVVSSGGEVHVLRGDGTDLPGFPVKTGVIPFVEAMAANAPAFASGAVPLPTDGVVSAPSVGDIDGDGDAELLVATLRGRLFAWHHDGAPVAGFPVRIEGRRPEEMTRGKGWDEGISSAPALGDIDGDGALEIVLGGMDQRLYAWRGDGSLFEGYPIELCAPGLCGGDGYRILASPALGDVDGDGDLDAALGTNEVPVGAAGLAYLVDLGSAQVHAGWPKARDGLINQTILPVLGEGHPSAIALADLRGEGTLQLASNAMLGSADLIDHEGEDALPIGYVADRFGERTNVDDGAFFGMATNPAFGDLNLDGVPDFVVGGSTVNYLVSVPGRSHQEYNHAVGAWDGVTGEAFAGFPRQVDDVSFLVAPTIADISGEGLPEVIYGSGGHFVYAWDHTGQIAPGWPKFTGGWSIGAAAVGDVDGDGWLDVVVGTREGQLFVWRTRGRADQAIQWASVHHDAQNTGNAHWPIPSQAGPPADPEAPGGCCGSGGAESGLAALLIAPWLRRRRRA